MKNILTYFLVIFSFTGLYAQYPDTKIWFPEKLSEIKINIQQKKEPYLTSFYDLKKRADESLNKEFLSVMQKDYMPPSGDKHDYVSMGPYWWPDPSKPDGLPYIRKDGLRNPELNKLDRLAVGKMVENVINLSLVYCFSGDQKYAEKAIEQLRVWFLNEDTKMNPNLNFGQFIPGHNDNKGRGTGIIDIYSFTVMLDGIEILKKSPAFTEVDKNGLQSWFSEFQQWLTTSEVAMEEKNNDNNHGVAYDVLLSRIALFTGDTGLYNQILESFPQNRLFKQIEPDGRQPRELARTMAMHYSLFNIDHILDMCNMAGDEGRELYFSRSEDGRSLSAAIDFVAQYAGKPQSEFPYEQIRSWDGVQNRLYRTLRRTSRFDPDNRYMEIYNKHYSETEAVEEDGISLTYLLTLLN